MKVSTVYPVGATCPKPGPKQMFSPGAKYSQFLPLYDY